MFQWMIEHQFCSPYWRLVGEFARQPLLGISISKNYPETVVHRAWCLHRSMAALSGKTQTEERQAIFTPQVTVMNHMSIHQDVVIEVVCVTSYVTTNATHFGRSMNNIIWLEPWRKACYRFRISKAPIRTVSKVEFRGYLDAPQHNVW